eukprot:COSAG02_NODE_56005_length_287_cov_1.372340_1_plen_23_part_01
MGKYVHMSQSDDRTDRPDHGEPL